MFYGKTNNAIVRGGCNPDRQTIYERFSFEKKSSKN